MSARSCKLSFSCQQSVTFQVHEVSIYVPPVERVVYLIHPSQQVRVSAPKQRKIVPKFQYLVVPSLTIQHSDEVMTVQDHFPPYFSYLLAICIIVCKGLTGVTRENNPQFLKKLANIKSFSITISTTWIRHDRLLHKQAYIQLPYERGQGSL